MKQARKNKLSSVYSPEPYEITQIKGSMITARNNNHYITRNCSFFKKLDSRKKDDSLSFDEIGRAEDEVPNNRPVNDMVEEFLTIEPNIIDDREGDIAIEDIAADDSRIEVRRNPPRNARRPEPLRADIQELLNSYGEEG